MGAEKTFHIGCQSWGYDDWITPVAGETVFYPSGTKREEMLGLYSRVFDTIEVDSTLYGIPAASTLENWYDETPPGFIFSLKFPREITHDLELKGPSLSLTREFVERAELLQEKLGVFLIQFPARFEATKDNACRVRDFLGQLPSDFRFTMEFRNEGWFTESTMDALAGAGVPLGLVEGKWVDRDLMFQYAPSILTQFTYIRIMGERDLRMFNRIQRHRDDVLERWVAEIKNLKATEMFIYVDNYFEGFAPGTVNKLKQLLQLPPSDPAELETQLSLF
ncbi:MAG: DUF72 domain-containing protein [Pyrinomonadaceae bacterium]